MLNETFSCDFQTLCCQRWPPVRFRNNGEEENMNSVLPDRSILNPSSSFESIEDPDYPLNVNYYENKRSSIMDREQPLLAIRPSRNAPRKHLRLNLFSTVL